MTNYVVDGSSRRSQVPPIVFIREEVEDIHFLHCEALVVRAVVAQNGQKRMLVDNESSFNILFGATFDMMIVDHELTLITTCLYGFTGDSITFTGKITLAIEMESHLKQVTTS